MAVERSGEVVPMTANGNQLTRVEVALVLLVLCAVGAAYMSLPVWLTAATLLATAALAWRASNRGEQWYAAALALPIPQSAIALRLSIADVLIVPVIVHEGLRWWTTRERLQSTLIKPLFLLLAITATATTVGYYRTSEWSLWALLNKGAGLAFQIAVVLALVQRIRTIEDVERMARWFVIGVSLANVVALIAVIMDVVGLPNTIYSSRLYGLMGQPSVTGGLLMVAAMIELGSLASAPAAGERRFLRWINLCLLGLSLVLTVSRSTWLSVAAASMVLLASLIWIRAHMSKVSLRHLAAVAMWLVVPMFLLGNILTANVRAGVTLLPADRATELRAEVIAQCEADPAPEFCRELSAPGAIPSTPAPSIQASSSPSAASGATAPPATTSPTPTAIPGDSGAAPAAPGVVAPAGVEVAGPMMNARGLNDRVAIVRAAWRDYTRNVSSMLLGIGLGTFYATSAADFGVPLIIHNTFVWYLVEFGPLGLAVVLWLWSITARNLWFAMRAGQESRELAAGLMAAFAGFAVFCMFNEGFYQRQLWLVMLLADRLFVASSWAERHATPAASSNYASAPPRLAV